MVSPSEYPILCKHSLKTVRQGDRVHLVGNGVNEIFQCVRIGRVDWFVSLKHGYERTRPQLCEQYVKAGCRFLVMEIPVQGWQS